MTDTYTPPLPSEFRSGNSVSVERATITRARMAEILAEAVEAYQRQQWRPIETAPRNGEIIILGLIDDTCVIVREGRWDDAAGQWTWPWISDLSPSIWMPLPPAPETQS